MLRAFKEHLKEMSKNPKDKFHLQVRKRVGKRATAILEKRLRLLILLMPDIVSRIYGLWRQQKAPSEVKKLGGFPLTYLYQTKDFLSAHERGLFGYLDDAYFTALVYEKVVEDLRQEAPSIMTSDDKKNYEKIKEFKRDAKIIIPKEALKIERMLEEIIKGEETVFASAFVS